MKTLKITLLLVAVVLLTVSGSSGDGMTIDKEKTFKQDNSSFDQLVVNKKKRTLKQNS